MKTSYLSFRFTDDQFDPELAATIGVDFKVKVSQSAFQRVFSFVVVIKVT